MKRWLSVFMLMVMMCLLTSCGQEATPTPQTNTTPTTTVTEEEENTLDKTRSYRLLMIGNSYTYYNDQWNIVHDIAANVGYTFEVDHVTQGGYYLDQHASLDNEFGQEIEAKLTGDPYDYVMLQEQSTCAVEDYDRFAAGVAALHEKAQANGAATVLYQTWARKEGCPTLTHKKWTVAGMALDLQQAYERVGAELDATVSPVGTAFLYVVTKYPELELYDPDGSHPSYAGSYLAALTHVSTITGVDAAKVTYNGELDAETAAVLKEAVSYTLSQQQ